MIQQPLALVGELWTCAWCAAGIRNGWIWHWDDCRWIEEIREGLVSDEHNTDKEG